MKNATYLVLQGPDGTTTDLDPFAQVALDGGGRLNVVHVGPVPLSGYSFTSGPYLVPSVPEYWLEERNRVASEMAEKQTQTRDYLLSQGLTGDVATLFVEPAAMHGMVAMRALFADISIVQNSLRPSETAFDNIMHGLLFEGPGPVLINPTATEMVVSPKTVMIAWNNSVSAARAVRAALPVLESASEVIVAGFDPDPTQWTDGENPGADLATWLSHHGCHVRVEEFATGHKSVDVALQDRAREHAVDLVVMGAYGRSRWSERFFGGTTDAMIKQRDLPVLLAH